MKEEKIALSTTCSLVVTFYDNPEGAKLFKPDISLEYVERSPDSWYTDTDTDIDIDEQKAKEIIDLLTKAL